MSKQANPTLIGGFVVGAVALVLGGTITFGGGELFEDRTTYVAYFDASITGLDVGAPVRFRGVVVGEVSQITAVYDQDDQTIRIPVEIEFLGDTIRSEQLEHETDRHAFIEHLIGQGMRAELSLDSLVTGKLSILLDFYPGTEVKLVGGHEHELPTISSGLEKLVRSLKDLPIEEIAKKTLKVLEDADKLLADPSLADAAKHLASALEKVDDQAGPLSQAAMDTLNDVRTLAQNADAEVKPLSDSTQLTLSDLRQLVEDVDAEVEPLSEAARSVLERLDSLFGGDYTLVYRLSETLTELAKAARSLRDLAEYLERHPEALISGKD